MQDSYEDDYDSFPIPEEVFEVYFQVLDPYATSVLTFLFYKVSENKNTDTPISLNEILEWCNFSARLVHKALNIMEKLGILKKTEDKTAIILTWEERVVLR